MKKVSYLGERNVTSILSFSYDSEHFTNNILQTNHNKALSQGIKEKEKPLPITRALARQFLKRFNEAPEQFAKVDYADNHVIPHIIEEAFNELGIDYFDTFKYDIQRFTLTYNDAYYSLTQELTDLIYFLWGSADGERQINWNFFEFREELHFNNMYQHDIPRSPMWILQERLKEAQLLPALLTEKDQKVVSESKRRANAEFSLAAYSNNPLTYAWLEIYFADVLRGEFGICTFCGNTMNFTDSIGQSRKKSACSEECKKKLRRQYDQIRKHRDLDGYKENQNERKRRSRAIKSIIDGKYTIKELSLKSEYSASELQDMVHNYKIKQLKNNNKNS